MNPMDLMAKAGERILPKWEALLSYARDNGISFGKDVKIHAIPGGGVVVNGTAPNNPWLHPWRVSVPDVKNRVRVSAGTVNGQVPWASESLRIGDRDPDTGQLAFTEVTPLEEGTTWIAVGVNPGFNGSDESKLGQNALWDQLRVAQITEQPRGFGSGGVRIDDLGWAWYPLVVFHWKKKKVARRFQIVYHNLNHEVAPGGQSAAQERHFFYAAG